MTFSQAEQKVLDTITPSQDFDPVVYDTIRKVENSLAKEQATVLMGGSSAKGTYLAGDHDIDLFIRFDREFEREEHISDVLGRCLQQVFDNVERIHGSRDYFMLQRGEYNFEFIPVLHISSFEHAQNVTDMSPLHVDYVSSYTSENPELCQHIRLLKQFCKATKTYGAESYIGGFSGYMVELLVICYGSFHAVLENVAKWQGKVILDPEEHHEDPLSVLNEAKTIAPIVLIDPVQRDRNAAAALTQEVFERFISASQKYLQSDIAGEHFFTLVPLDKETFEKPEGTVGIMVTLKPLQGKKDVVGAKCAKVFGHLRQTLHDHEFQIVHSSWEFQQDKAVLFFAIPPSKLSKTRIIQGPPVTMQEHAKKFKQRHKKTMEKEGALYAEEKRAFVDASKLIEHVLKDKFVLERVASSKSTTF
jgi:tRNA nucleotidyltransferase (CCA-adding enzyme)